jgi:hypothetical protein
MEMFTVMGLELAMVMDMDFLMIIVIIMVIILSIINIIKEMDMDTTIQKSNIVYQISDLEIKPYKNGTGIQLEYYQSNYDGNGLGSGYTWRDGSGRGIIIRYRNINQLEELL